MSNTSKEKDFPIQLKVSQLDNSDCGARESGAQSMHDPWPTHTKKHTNSANGPRKSRRQSVLAKEFEKLQKHGAEGANAALNGDNIAESTDTLEVSSAHKRRRRSSARRGSVFDPPAMECQAKRKQSLLPVLRAASKGEELEVIQGIGSNASLRGGQPGATSSSSVSQAFQELRRSSIAVTEKPTKRERSGSIAQQQDEWLSSVANMKRRSRTSSFAKEGVASEVSQQLSKSGKLEDQINLQHLVELMRIFNEADENGSDGLDMDEFQAAFGQILGQGKNEQQMAIMFMKIDTNCDGTVDWDEFCTYMLLEYQEKEVMAGEKLPPFPYPMQLMHNPRPVHEMISGIGFLPSLHRHTRNNGSTSPPIGDEDPMSHDLMEGGRGSDGVEGRYISICRDGSLFFWKSNLTLQRTISLEEGKTAKLTWVTGMAIMPNVNKLMLSFTDNMLSLYDLSSAHCDRLFQIVSLSHCVLTMNYWYDHKDYNRAVLVMGDCGGGVCIMELTTASAHHFGLQFGIHDSHRIPFPELLYRKHDGVKVTYIPKVHSDWVLRVKYCPVIGYTMSCSNDSSCSLHLTDLHGIKESAVLKVRKGVSSFDYCKEWNIIATGGLDRILRYWNPYVPAKPIAILKGHNTAILHVAIDSRHGHVLSLSKDMELRVWDIQDQLCVQSCHRCQPLQPHLPTAFYLHPHTGILLVGSSQLGALEPSLNDEQLSMRGDVVSHERPLCAAMYNENFNQVVSGCHGSVVSVWDVDSGEKTMQFSHCHGNMEITAMAFDTAGRRLITGGRDGSLKIWNFNNGACLSVLQTKYDVEVTCINFMKGRVIVGGWSRCLTEYGDHRDRDDVIPKYWGEGIHKEDILCMSTQEPNMLASASYDGDIIIWNVDVERSICKLNAADEKSRGEHWKGIKCGSSECIVEGTSTSKVKSSNIDRPRSKIKEKRRQGIKGQTSRCTSINGMSSCELNSSDERSKRDHWSGWIKRDDSQCVIDEKDVCHLDAPDWKEYWRGRKNESLKRLSKSSSRLSMKKSSSSLFSRSRRIKSSVSEQHGLVQTKLMTAKEHAIEKVAFLQTRPMDQDSASLIACGTGGWIQMWNIYGGGLIGEFNVWDNLRHRLDKEDRQLQSVTALKIDSNNDLMITGNSIGYVQLWEIDEYCYQVSAADKPVKSPPPHSLAWRAHLNSIVSVDLAENKGLIITASTDCCVRMFTLNGRYIGTFGEKSPWQLSYPIKLVNLPRKAPPRLNKRASFRTIQIVSGPTTSKWKLAKNLFRMLLQAKRKQAALDLFGIGADLASWETSESTTSSSILGRHYQRRSRFREPIVPTKLQVCDGKLQGVYSSLICSDIQEPNGCRPPSSVNHHLGNSMVYGHLHSDELIALPRHFSERKLPKNPHTESSLLPPLINSRKVTITG